MLTTLLAAQEASEKREAAHTLEEAFRSRAEAPCGIGLPGFYPAVASPAIALGRERLSRTSIVTVMTTGTLEALCQRYCTRRARCELLENAGIGRRGAAARWRNFTLLVKR
jgi:hypothetical protein